MSSIFVFIATRTTLDVAIPARAGNQDEFNRKIAGALTEFNGGLLNVGDLKLRPTAAAVPNHLLCDGSEVSRAQFPQLFAYLGATEGEGDGETTFNLPNYMGDALAASEAPPQVVTEGGTITSEDQVLVPPANAGQTRGGNVLAGGRRQRTGQ